MAGRDSGGASGPKGGVLRVEAASVSGSLLQAGGAHVTPVSWFPSRFPTWSLELLRRPPVFTPLKIWRREEVELLPKQIAFTILNDSLGALLTSAIL